MKLSVAALRLRTQILGAFLIVVVLYGIALSAAMIITRSMSTTEKEIFDRILHVYDLAQRSQIALRIIDDEAKTAFIDSDPAQMSSSLQRVKDRTDELNSIVKDMGTITLDDTERPAWEAFQRVTFGSDGYLPLIQQAIQAKRRGQNALATRLIQGSSLVKSEDALRVIFKHNVDWARAATINSIGLGTLAITLGTILGTVAFLAAVIIAIIIARSIAGRVGVTTRALREIVDDDFDRLSRSFEALARGDLTATVKNSTLDIIDVRGRDEIAHLTHSYNKMVTGLRTMTAAYQTSIERLRDAMGKVTTGADRVSTAGFEMSAATTQSNAAVEEISLAVSEVFQGARQQADRVAMTNAALQELTRSSKQIATGAADQSNSVQRSAAAVEMLIAQIQAMTQVARELSVSAKNSSVETEAGTQVVERTRTAMERIREQAELGVKAVNALSARSSAVETIVSAIEEISDQTNLLALNAAIEAARAGEQGRGFSVVADEIRKLAERAASSTKEIGQILAAIRGETVQAERAMKASSEATETGFELAMAASNVLKKLEAAISQTDVAAADLTQRAETMSHASDELSTNMSSVGAVVEQNAAAAEEMSSTAFSIGEMMSEVATSAQEQSATVQQVAASASELAAQVAEIAATAQELSGEGAALKSLVATFRLEHGEQIAAVPAMHALQS